MVIAKNIVVEISGKKILKSINFKIQKGRVTSFVGKSGSGKTTLLKCICNLINAYSGDLFLNKKSINSLSTEGRVKSIGFVTQHFDLFPNMTVLQNCMHPQIHALKKNKNDSKDKAIQLLKALDIENLQNKYPSNISGGQKQRVAIVRALCLGPKLLLFDEPTSALDPQSTAIFKDILNDLVKKGVTVVLCSHDMPFIKSILDVVYLMEDGEIKDFYDKELDNFQQTEYLYDFLKY